MAIAGLDFSFEKSKQQFYIEGTYKNWFNSTEEDTAKGKGRGIDPGNQHFAPRELFYRYNEGFKLTIGLQSMTFGDYFLVDERVVGINFEKKFETIHINSSIGTVGRLAARQRRVCGMRHLYNLAGGASYDYVGDNFGETNFLGAVLKYIPSTKSMPNDDKKQTGNDEFEQFDEFSDGFEDLSSSTKTRNFLNEIGLLYYQEFGSGFNHNFKHYFGGLALINLPLEMKLKTELVYQYITDENSLVYYGEIARDFNWESGDLTSINLGYLGKLSESDSTLFYPSFSNFYLGEVMRLDAKEIPIIFGSITHRFPFSNKFFIKLQGIAQLQEQQTNEIDLELSARFFEHIKLTGIFSRIQSNPLEEIYYMARLELRAAF
mgnify:CR=1 FL=1